MSVRVLFERWTNLPCKEEGRKGRRGRKRDGWEHMVKNEWKTLLERWTNLDLTWFRMWPYSGACIGEGP